MKCIHVVLLYIKVEDGASDICDSGKSSTSSSIAMERATSPDCEKWVKLKRRTIVPIGQEYHYSRSVVVDAINND